MTFHDLPQPLPSLLDELDDEAHEQLLLLWRSARLRQHEHLLEAMDQILQGVPAVLRRAVRKILV